MKKLVFVIIILASTISCDPVDKRLKLINKSPDLIFYSTSVGDSLMGRSPFKNAYRIEKNDTIWDKSSNLVLADSSKHLTIIGKNAWKSYINKQCQDSSLRIFVFKKGLISSQPWDSLKKNQLYSKKYSYKVKDLEKLGWRVEYKE